MSSAYRLDPDGITRKEVEDLLVQTGVPRTDVPEAADGVIKIMEVGEFASVGDLPAVAGLLWPNIVLGEN